jgi:hypothetical protein
MIMGLIETYYDGELIETREEEAVIPNIGGFISQMMVSEAYNKIIVNTSNQQIKNRLEIAAVRLELKGFISDEDLQVFKNLWDAVVNLVSNSAIQLDDRDSLNQIAESNNMPFSFDDDFKMIIGEK